LIGLGCLAGVRGEELILGEGRKKTVSRNSDTAIRGDLGKSGRPARREDIP